MTMEGGVPPALTDRFMAAADRAPRTDPGRGFFVVPRGCPPVMTRCHIVVPAGTYRRTVHRQAIVGITVTLIFTGGDTSTHPFCINILCSAQMVK
jgi:hypothetical protein